MNYHDFTYLTLMAKILEKGVHKGDRTGTGTLSLFGEQMKFDLSNMSIPLLTTKKMFTRGLLHEILWYLQGSTNIGYLTDHNVHIWDEWADENGDLGPVYGKQWRAWEKPASIYEQEGEIVFDRFEDSHVDQIAQVIEQLRTNPNDRRIIVSAWNVGEIDKMALPPCHLLFQFWAHEGELKCQLYQRSCDFFLGVPFNIVQYSILTHMIAQVTGHQATEFIWTGGDVHLYTNHLDQAKLQLTRDPHPSPTLWLNPEVKEINDFRIEDFKIVDYIFHPTIKAEVSV